MVRIDSVSVLNEVYLMRESGVTEPEISKKFGAPTNQHEVNLNLLKLHLKGYIHRDNGVYTITPEGINVIERIPFMARNI